MTNPTGPMSAVGVMWRRWLGFWFLPADPTPLGFIRVVTGCLVLYTHLAYSFDLRAFFGPDAWYGLAEIDRERREIPHFAPSFWAWDAGPVSATLPAQDHRRRAMMGYYRRLAADFPDRARLDPALAYLDRVQRLPNLVAIKDAVDYCKDLSPDPTFRRNQLAAVADPAVADKRKGEVLPAFLAVTPPDERKKVADELEAFAATLPADADARRYVVDHLADVEPAVRAAILEFLRDLPALDAGEKARRLDYLDYWGSEARRAIRLGNPIFSHWFHVTDPAGMAAAHAAVLVVILLFTVGAWTRVTSVLTWLATVGYIHRTQHVLFGMDTMANILLLYLMVGNSGAALSVDRLANRYRAVRASLRRAGGVDAAAQAYLAAPPRSASAGFALRLLQVHFCFIYMASGLSKLKGGAWWNTNAYWDTLANPEFTLIHYQWYEWLVRQAVSVRPLYAVLAAVGVAGTFVTEIGLPFLVWTRMRPYIVMLALCFHAGIAVFMGLWVFSLLMMTMLVGYLPGAAIRARLFGPAAPAGGRVAVRFDPRADRQARAAALARAFDFDDKVDLVPAAAGRPLAVSAGGREATGPAAAAELFARVGWLAPFRWARRAPGVGGALTRLFTGESAPAVAASVGKPGLPTAS